MYIPVHFSCLSLLSLQNLLLKDNTELLDVLQTVKKDDNINSNSPEAAPLNSSEAPDKYDGDIQGPTVSYIVNLSSWSLHKHL